MPYTYVPPTEQAAATQQVAASQPEGTSTQAPADAREQVYQKYYGQDQQAQPQQQIKEPAQVVTANIPTELVDTLKSIKEGMEALRAPAQPQKVEEGLGPVAWVEKIRQGDFEGAEQVLLKKVLAGVQPILEQERTRVQQEAMSATQVNLEIDRHVQTIRMQNPDIVPFEKYLQAPVAQRVEQAKVAGKIKTPQDFVEVYKSAIDAEVGELRNLGLVLRGQGKQEAQVRNQQVLSSTTLSPNQVQSTNQPIQDTQQAPDVSIESYFARRRSDENRRRGLEL